MEFLPLMINAVLFISKTSSSSADLIEEVDGVGKIFSFHSSENWTNAVQVCNDRGEKLATMDDLNTMDSAVWIRHNLTDRELWTSNTYIQTPFITKTGCFQAVDNITVTTDLRVYGDSPVAVCYAYCFGKTKFALYGSFCVCDPPQNMDVHRDNVCRNKDTEKRLETFTVSAYNYDPDTMTEESILVLWTCRKDTERMPKGSYSRTSESKITTDKHAGCLSPDGTIQLLPKTYLSWNIVDQACLKLTGMPVATHMNEGHCKKFADSIPSILTDDAFITGNRTYHSIISIADISASGISFNHILCKTFTWNGTFNLTEGNSSKLVRCHDGKKNFICIKGIHQEAMSTRSVLIVITLVASLLNTVVCILMFMICYKRRYSSKQRSRNNEKNEGKTYTRTTSDEQYNHNISNGRITTENKADKSKSDDSETDSDFSSDSVKYESETLNKGGMTPQLQLQIPDDSCNYSYASACEHVPLKDVPVGDVILRLNYANKPDIELFPDKKEAEYLNI